MLHSSLLSVVAIFHRTIGAGQQGNNIEQTHSSMTSTNHAMEKPIAINTDESSFQKFQSNF
jgi:hypothetical protein